MLACSEIKPLKASLLLPPEDLAHHKVGQETHSVSESLPANLGELACLIFGTNSHRALKPNVGSEANM